MKIMKVGLSGFAALLLVFSASIVQAIPITYNISLTEGTNTLTGAIQTDGAIGAIATANISSWSFSQSGPGAFAFDSTMAGTQFQCIGTNGCFTSTLTTLAFNFDSLIANDPFSNFQDSVGNSVNFLSTLQSGIHGIRAGQTDYIVPSSNIFARTSSVPEPSVIALMGLGLLGFVATRRKQKKN